MIIIVSNSTSLIEWRNGIVGRSHNHKKKAENWTVQFYQLWIELHWHSMPVNVQQPNRNVYRPVRSMSYRPLSLLTNSWKRKKKNTVVSSFSPPIFLVRLLNCVCVLVYLPLWAVYSEEDRVTDLSVASGRPSSSVAALGVRTRSSGSTQHVLLLFASITRVYQHCSN